MKTIILTAILSLLFIPTSHAIDVHNEQGQLVMIIDEYQRDCRIWKIAENHFFTGTEKQVNNFHTGEKINRGFCWTTNSYMTHVLGVIPEARLYQSQPEEMKQFISEENQKVFKTKQKERKVASLIAELEKALGRSINIF